MTSIKPGSGHGSVLSRPHPLRNRNRHRTSTDGDSAPVPTYSLHPPTQSPRSINAPLSVRQHSPSPSELPPPYSPPTTSPRNPLDIPEILTRVGQFLPLWVQGDLENQARFRPRTLVRCTAVSRLWYRVMSPILWYLYDDALMNSVPRDTVHRNVRFTKVLLHQHIYGGKLFECENLIQLSTAPWVMGIEDLVRRNTRLERFSWHTNGYYKTVRPSMFEALAGKGGDKGRDMKELTKLRELEFVGCELDPKDLFPLLENHLPGLRILILQDVVILPIKNSSGMSSSHYNASTNSDAAIALTPKARFTQIREVRMGKNIEESGNNLVDILQCCPNLERVVIDGIDHNWTMNRTHFVASNDVLDRFTNNLIVGCKNLKSVSYLPHRGLHVALGGLGAVGLLGDENLARLIRCIDPRIRAKRHEQERDQDRRHSDERNAGSSSSSNVIPRNDIKAADDDDEPRTMYSFCADMLLLETETTLSLCHLDTTLESVYLRLHQSDTETVARTNLLNAHQILASCSALRHFSMEYENHHNLYENIATASTATLLFDNPWACLQLETLTIDGVKRGMDPELDNSRSAYDTEARRDPLEKEFSDVPSQRSHICMPVRLRDLMALAGLIKVPHITNLINMGRRKKLSDLDDLQGKMFKQLSKLKKMSLLTFNGDTFRDFSKLAYV